MMVKRTLLAGLVLVSLAASANARTVEERLIAGLKSQGYVILEDGYTFLGRLRIVAENATYHREIVVNPETGEVLRDYAVLMADLAPAKPLTAVASTGDSDGSDAGSDPSPGIAATATDTIAPAADPLPPVGQTPGAGSGDLLLADPVVTPDVTAP